MCDFLNFIIFYINFMIVHKLTAECVINSDIRRLKSVWIVKPSIYTTQYFVVYIRANNYFSNSYRDTLKPRLAKISDDKIPLVLAFHPFNYKVRDVSDFHR